MVEEYLKNVVFEVREKTLQAAEEIQVREIIHIISCYEVLSHTF